MIAPVPDPARLTGRDIVCVGFADWDTELPTNQHHLMSRLAADNRVLFIESLGLRRPQLAGRDLKRIAKRLRRGLAPARTAPGGRDRVHVLSPLVLPLHSNALVRRLNARLLPALVQRSIKHLNFHDPILWAYVPQAEALLHALDPSLVVYHCVDDIAAQPGVDGESFRAAEARFAARADLVLASAPALAARMRTLNDNVLDAPNVADTAAFATALQPGPVDPAIDALPHPRIVFTGAVVATKLDVHLIADVARARPDWSFALVGPTGMGDPSTDVSALHDVSNIHLLGGRHHSALPDVLRGADVGIIPYACNQLTASIFPMKVYEYLAAGLPVVATALPALADVTAITTAADAPSFAAALDTALTHTSDEDRTARSHAAAAHSWDTRLTEIATAIATLDGDSPP
jgi:glycosyltransferase involved in cell wall biosynthesis